MMKFDGIICCAGWGINPESLKLFCAEMFELGRSFFRCSIDDHAFKKSDIYLVSPNDYQTKLADVISTGTSKKYLGIGYSMGFACLAQLPIQWGGLIALSGFSRFCASYEQPSGTPKRVLERMIKAFETNPNAVLNDFMVRAKVPFEYAQDISDASSKTQSLNSLQQLMGLDMTQQLCSLECPLLVLSSLSDQIVPVSLVDACFQQTHANLVRYDDVDMPVGHALPYLAKAWCQEQMMHWIEYHA